MATDIKVPSLGESVTTATVARWLKQAGAIVAADEPVVELETDKVTVEVNATVAGTLGPQLAAEGAEVEVGALLASIDTDNQAMPTAAARPQGVIEPPAPPGPLARPADTAHPPLPTAAKLMQERHLQTADIGSGSGKDGRITKGDVLAFTRSGAVQEPPPQVSQVPKSSRAPAGGEERVKMTRLRRTIAARLKEAQNNAAMLTTFNEVDMSAAMALRADYKEAFEKKHGGVRLGFMGFFVRACVVALQEYPAVNAEIDGDEIVYKHFVHMGIAVGGPNGLVVPIIRDADRMSLAEIETAITGFGRAARDGKLRIDDLGERHLQHHQWRRLWFAHVYADTESPLSRQFWGCTRYRIAPSPLPAR